MEIIGLTKLNLVCPFLVCRKFGLLKLNVLALRRR